MTARPRHLLLMALFVLGLLLLGFQLAGAVASARAVAARGELRAGRPQRALEGAEAALRLDPWQADAAQARLVALQRLQRWRHLADAASDAFPWHPYSPGVLLLLGEAQAQLDRPQESAETLFRALARAPRPRSNPAQLWRLAMTQGELAWGPDDPRCRLAARQVLALLDDDPHLTDRDRQAARREAETLLAQ